MWSGEAKAALEAEAHPDGEDDPSPPSGAGPKSNDAPSPDDKTQRNFTDPESKILKTKDGFIQGYNCQAAVDSWAQVIVACDVVAAQNDAPLLIPMIDQVKANTGRQAEEVSADSGYCSESNLVELRRRRLRGYIATGRRAHDGREPRRDLQGRLTRAMRAKLARGGHRSRYRLRKQIVEPVFGQIKAARGFRSFLLRGLSNVTAEWALVCTSHNLLKLARQ